MRETLHTYGAEARVLLPTAVMVFVPLGLLDALSKHLAHLEVEDFDPLAYALLAAAVGQFAVAALGDEFYTGVAAAAVAESRTGKRPHRLVRLARTLPYGTLIAADVVVALGTSVGLALLIVPGVVFFTWFSLVGPVIKIEGLGLWASFRRSYRLVRRSFWRVLLLLTMVYVGGDVLTLLVQNGSLWIIGQSFLGDWAAAAAVSVLITPVAAVSAVVLSYELIELDRRRPVGVNPASSEREE
ncbi:MAG: hypothetical protein M3322_04255 [Actinomycetota bacterium]|nr:hypothetical protein [Actinomycetota bacterium]